MLILQQGNYYTKAEFSRNKAMSQQ